jgi:predicted membrane protein
MEPRSKFWSARLLIGLVLIINLQSAFVFFWKPATFAPAYELIGVPGQAAIQGFAVLFLMWNIPYLVAWIHPIRFRVSLYEAIAMQSIGLIGESLILWGLPVEHTILRSSITRFIIFDGGGLMALIAAAWITKSIQQGIKNG